MLNIFHETTLFQYYPCPDLLPPMQLSDPQQNQHETVTHNANTTSHCCQSHGYCCRKQTLGIHKIPVTSMLKLATLLLVTWILLQKTETLHKLTVTSMLKLVPLSVGHMDTVIEYRNTLHSQASCNIYAKICPLLSVTWILRQNTETLYIHKLPVSSMQKLVSLQKLRLGYEVSLHILGLRIMNLEWPVPFVAEFPFLKTTISFLYYLMW